MKNSLSHKLSSTDFTFLSDFNFFNSVAASVSAVDVASSSSGANDFVVDTLQCGFSVVVS